MKGNVQDKNQLSANKLNLAASNNNEDSIFESNSKENHSFLNKKRNLNSSGSGETFESESKSSQISQLNSSNNKHVKTKSFTLSESTFSIIKKLSMNSDKKVFRRKKTNEFFPKKLKSLNFNLSLFDSCKEILEKPSIRERYGSLLKRDLVLPVKYKILYRFFAFLDESINFLKTKHTEVNFSMIKSYIYEKHNKNIDLKIFKQILFVVPHFFVYKNLGEFSLIIDIPHDIKERIYEIYDENSDFIRLQTTFKPYEGILPNEILKKRREIFKKILLSITYEFYKENMKKINIKLNFNPIRQKAWNHLFDVHNCPDIDCFEILDILS